MARSLPSGVCVSVVVNDLTETQSKKRVTFGPFKLFDLPAGIPSALGPLNLLIRVRVVEDQAMTEFVCASPSSSRGAAGRSRAFCAMG